MKQSYSFKQTARQLVFDRLACELAKEEGIIFAYVFGSALDSESFHDVDVGLYLDDSQLSQRSEITSGLADRLSGTIGLPVDIRILNSAPVFFLYHVFRGRLILSRDENLLTNLLEEIPRLYLDIAPLLRQSTKDAFAQ